MTAEDLLKAIDQLEEIVKVRRGSNTGWNYAEVDEEVEEAPVISTNRPKRKRTRKPKKSKPNRFEKKRLIRIG